MGGEQFMARALELARRGEGLTRPNPPVGAVVVRDGVVIGEGWHRKVGGPHAEVYALWQAGDGARGATLYVTLEPCSTEGRTPPCTQRIVESGVAEVVIATNDPNPHHAGRGIRLLRRHGVRVRQSVCAEEGLDLIRPFTSWMLAGRPYLTLKLGTTLDGRIADRRGRSRWITGPEAREEVQALRRRADAIMVGAGTIRKDNPSLWPRPAKGRNPWRVVVDTNGHTRPSAQVYTDAHAVRTVLAVGRCVTERRLQSYSRCGTECLFVPAGRTASVRRVMKALAERGVLHVLCEGGGGLASSLIRAGVVDEYAFFVAPNIMGGTAGYSAVGGPGWQLPNLPRLQFVEERRVGDDLLIRARNAETES